MDRSLTCSSPVRHSAALRRGRRVRLACVRHAASVYPEPGSNSPFNPQLLALSSRESHNAFSGPLASRTLQLLRCRSSVDAPPSGRAAMRTTTPRCPDSSHRVGRGAQRTVYRVLAAPVKSTRPARAGRGSPRGGRAVRERQVPTNSGQWPGRRTGGAPRGRPQLRIAAPRLGSTGVPSRCTVYRASPVATVLVLLARDFEPSKVRRVRPLGRRREGESTASRAPGVKGPRGVAAVWTRAASRPCGPVSRDRTGMIRHPDLALSRGGGTSFSPRRDPPRWTVLNRA